VRTAVDSSVLLDVLLDDSRFAETAQELLRASAAAGPLMACECVLAEVRPALGEGDLEAMLGDFGIEFVPSTRHSALLAGEMMQTYLRRTSVRRTRVVADFLIGAHAQVYADRLIARDRGFFRDYFAGLTVVEPKGAARPGR